MKVYLKQHPKIYLIIRKRKGVISYDTPEFNSVCSTKKYAKIVEIWANLFNILYQVKDLDYLLSNKTKELIFMRNVVQRQF